MNNLINLKLRKLLKLIFPQMFYSKKFFTNIVLGLKLLLSQKYFIANYHNFDITEPKKQTCNDIVNMVQKA